MDIFLIILASILALLGFLSNFIPILPGGVLFNYISLLILFFIHKSEYGVVGLVVFGFITIITMILDNFIPAAAAQSKGATKKGIIGATIGTFVGMFIFPPFGIILGVVIGAVVGELLAYQEFNKALKVGIWSFIGFLLSTFIKIIVTGVMLFYFIINLIK